MTDLPPFLYHATSNWRSEKIKTEGMVPRKERPGDLGYWEYKDISSNTHMVHLTADPSMATFAGKNTTYRDDTSTYTILTIDTSKLDRSLLRIDENTLTHKGPEDGSRSYFSYAEAAELAHCDDRWQLSLNNGFDSNVGYEGRIPPDAIVKYTTRARYDESPLTTDLNPV